METYRKKQPELEKKTTYLLVIISRGSVTPVQILTNSTYHSLVSPNNHLNGLMYTHWTYYILTLQEVIKMDVDHIENLEKKPSGTILLLM